MLQRSWQSLMISLALSPGVTRFMQRNRATSFLVDQFVAGDCANSAVKQAQTLFNTKKIRSSLFYLGEYVNDPEKVKDNVKGKLSASNALANSRLDLHISLDPSQIGHFIDSKSARDHAHRIASVIQNLASSHEGIHCLMLDMEDESIVNATIALHNELKQNGYPVALTLQAYLKRTEQDLHNQITHGAMVRLVKGAFVGESTYAFTRQKDIKANYKKLIQTMLSPEARERGFYPVIATHDENMHEVAIRHARASGWSPGEYEFEMLYGVRTNIAEQLVQLGERIRVYLPFGRDWWPYAVRRIGENPKNGILLLRSLFK